MKLECDFTEDEIAILCDVLMNTALNCYDTAQNIVKKENLSDNDKKDIARLYHSSRSMTDISQKILLDIGVKGTE